MSGFNPNRAERRARLRKAARISAKAQGCTCKPSIHQRPAGVLDARFSVAHDDDCPLVDAGSTIVLVGPTFGWCER